MESQNYQQTISISLLDIKYMDRLEKMYSYQVNQGANKYVQLS